MIKGKYIVIEGPEGVGKTTQIQMLGNAFKSAGLPVLVMREPDSQNNLTARAIRRLTQDPQFPMNTRTEVLLYNAARSQSLETIRNNLEQGIMCLVDRNYLTTLAVQYYGRGDVPDYDQINAIISFAVGDMEPDLTMVLDAEVPTLRERLKDRYRGERFDNLDDAFLERVRAGYLWEAKQRSLPVIYAVDSVEEVFKSVWNLAAQTLAQRTPVTTTPAKVSAPQSLAEIIAAKPELEAIVATETVELADPKQPLVEKNENGSFVITNAGESYLKDIVTNTKGNVYAFTEKLSPITIAAAMARLSRRGDDMRITILDEFANNLGKDEKLLQRVITAYGDDSVQQLAGQHVVVENASNILTKKLEWGRLAAYLEQSTRYIYFDQKDINGHYKYYVPDYLDSKTKQKYIKQMNLIFDKYSELVHKLTVYIQQNSTVPKAEQDGAWKAATRAQACDAARPMLPVAVKSTVGIFASGQALESLIMHLLSDPLPEAHSVGISLLVEARKVFGSLLERVDINERGVALQGYRAYTYEGVKELANEFLPAQHTDITQDPVQLTDVWPRNELDLVPDMLYEHSDLSLEELRKSVVIWPYQRKVDVFKAYVGERFNRRHRPGRAMEKAHYSWDLICDYGIFRDLQRHRIVDDLEWQSLSPRYGYDVPELVDQAGLSDLFDSCFDISLSLYSELQASNYNMEAQYATLLGHKMRWKVTYNAREAFHLHELRTSPQGHPGYRKLVQQMHEKVAEVHPLMAESMKFVNIGEDPELTRLAAERYTQTKLQQLDNPKN
jgi:dTMP kinase